MTDLAVRIVALQRLLTELLSRVTLLEARIAAMEQQNAGRWYS